MMKLLMRCFLMTSWLLHLDSAFALKPPSDAEIARFLHHASFGATEESIAHVKAVGYQAYLNEQFNLPPPDYPQYSEAPTATPGGDVCDANCRRDLYSPYPLQVRFYRNAITAPDQLRQRVAFALSQILVVSGYDYNIRHPSRLLPYLKLLDKHAFGNYRDLLKEITLNPAMGMYLDMAGNSKWGPNENYARELLQLFSIGLFQLNKDGTPKKGKGGQPIATYSQAEVTAFSRIFTGWNLATAPEDPSLKSYSTPMLASPSAHDNDAKTVLGGVPIAAGMGLTAEGMQQELNLALENIVNHPNVAPFISRQLIQHLVTSNPSSAYVGRVSSVFQSNAGDMKKVISAILLDKEALKAPSKSGGHLRSPVLWLTHLLRAFKVTEATTDFVLFDSYLPKQYRMSLDVYRAPSVFNYYPPDFPLPNSKLQGPEFAIFSTTEAFNRVNFAYALINKQISTSSDRPKGTWIDYTALQPLAANPAALVAKLATMLMPEGMNPKVQPLLAQIVGWPPESERLQHAIYWLATSPEFMIEK